MTTENKYFICLMNRELKRLHNYLFYNLPWKESPGNEKNVDWAKDRIVQIHKAMQPVIFIPKGSGVDDIKF